MSPFHSFINYWKDNNIGAGYTLSVGEELPEVYPQVIITEYGGDTDFILPIFYPKIQIMFVNSNQQQLMEDAWNVFILLKGIKYVAMGDTIVHTLRFRQTPSELPRVERQDPFRRVFNFTLVTT